MQKVFIKRDDPSGLDKALRKFKAICFEIEKDAKKHEFYLRPGLRKIEKSKEAQRKRLQELKRRKNHGR